MKEYHSDKKSYNSWLILVAVAVIAGIVIFAIPISYSKTEYYTETVKYETQESYQETVNQDNCDSSPSCVCKDHGGFLWLTCVQCSCTKSRTVVREKLVLKEGTINDRTTLYKSWTNSIISESEARSIASKLLDFSAQKDGRAYPVNGATKEGNIWKISASGGVQNLIIEIDANNGKINYVDSGGVKVGMSNILQMNS